jgi:hypothetical protein
MTDYSELKAAALAATQGVWVARADGWTIRAYPDNRLASDGIKVVHTCSAHMQGQGSEPDVEQQVANQHYIEQAQPTAVLELIDEVESLSYWRALALQFDNHRMAALWHLKALLQSHEHAGAVHDFLDAPPMASHEVVAERDQLRAENERLQRFETAYKEFSDKTEWVRPNAAAHELGMHVADVIRKRCDDLTAHCQAQADEIVRLRKERDGLAADYAALAEDPGSAL